MAAGSFISSGIFFGIDDFGSDGALDLGFSKSELELKLLSETLNALRSIWASLDSIEFS